MQLTQIFFKTQLKKIKRNKINKQMNFQTLNKFKSRLMTVPDESTEQKISNLDELAFFFFLINHSDFTLIHISTKISNVP